MDLSDQQAVAILRRAGVDGPIEARLLHRENHVWQLDSEAGMFFLKTHTKDWYAHAPNGDPFTVEHERAAWACLAAHGLAAPEVVLVERGGDNPLGRPFILTRDLRGKPMTTYIGDRAFESVLVAVARNMARMHGITFPYAGYITADGPTAPPCEDAWQHRCWTAAQRQRDVLALLYRADAPLPDQLVRRLEPLFSHMAERLAAAYEPPRFVHGDCHAHQFFVFEENGAWRVSGVVDMEVASAGDSVEDLLHFCMELAALLSPATRWWQPFFAAYGAPPPFDLFRLRLLGVTPEEFAAYRWPGTWAAILERLLAAGDWDALFTLGPA